jgi:Ca2+-binding RTX toxin-like protein
MSSANVSRFIFKVVQDIADEARFRAMKGLVCLDGITWQQIKELVMEQSGRNAACEPLESRRMMAVDVSLSSGQLWIEGTIWGDTIKVYPDGSYVCVNTDSDAAYEARYSSVMVNVIIIRPDAGNDYVNVYNTLDIDAQILGGSGRDTLGGGGGDDLIIGDGGDDMIDGDDGDDFLSGSSGDDTLEGDAGDDTLYGSDGKDYLYGDSGDDELWGDDGSDYLKGGDGSDVLHPDSDDWYVVVS